MHARHRSPGNGYRSGSMGVSAGSRVAAESSFRGRGMYNSEYRSYNRGFGRGQSKPLPIAQPPRRPDIFMEAGRLATEYLVSKGLLPQNVLSGKWQNGGLKNLEEDGFHPPEGRTSALARLGAVSDGGSGRRRLSDEYLPPGSRSNLRGRKRSGSFKNYDSDWGRETGRSGSSSDTPRGSPDTEAVDSFTGYKEERPIGTDIASGGKKSSAGELAAENYGAGESESSVGKIQSQDGTSAKPSSSTSGKDIEPETTMELVKTPDDMKLLPNEESVEVKNDSGSLHVEKQSVTENLAPKITSKEGSSSDLLSLCRFAKVPTRTRSALLPRGSKADSTLIAQEEKVHDLDLEQNNSSIEPIVGSDISMKDVTVHDCPVDASSNELQRSSDLDSSKETAVLPAESAGETGLLSAELRKCTRSVSFADGSLMNKQESNEQHLGFGRCSSMIVERGEKRAAENINSNEGMMKKRREWVPSVVSQDNEFSHITNLRQEQLTSREGNQSTGKEVILSVEQEIPVDMSLFQTGGAGPCIDFTEEKPLFTGSSFKICDLNLMEANENSDADTNLIFPSIPESKLEATPIDVDLSISHNSIVPDKYGRRGPNGKEVEVIDLENDSVQEDKAFSSTNMKSEAAFTGLESFPNHAQNTNDISDNQDGYGLMISELLETDITNCSSGPPDMNSLHNEMSLHNGEGILGDDESIYMSLEEIPISFLRVWEQQPTQEYDKPF